MLAAEDFRTAGIGCMLFNFAARVRPTFALGIGSMLNRPALQAIVPAITRAGICYKRFRSIP
jgi:hypothetical protein